MKIPINLASQPFRRDRAMIVASLAVIAALVVMLAFLLVFIRNDREELRRLASGYCAAQSADRRAPPPIRRASTASCASPQNASVLEWSVFINTLIYHKAISWSQLLTDLEKTLPYDVKVVAIHPTIDDQNHVKLDMTLGGDKPGPIVEAIRAFENSPAFGRVLPGNMNPPTQAEPLYRYRMTVNYAQKL